MRVLGATAVRVEIVKEDITYIWGSIEPGHWDFSAWGDDVLYVLYVLYVRVRAADGELSVIKIDDIRARG